RAPSLRSHSHGSSRRLGTAEVDPVLPSHQWRGHVLEGVLTAGDHVYDGGAAGGDGRREGACEVFRALDADAFATDGAGDCGVVVGSELGGYGSVALTVAHPAERAVVEDDDHDRDFFFAGGHEAVHANPETAIA